MVAKPAAPPPPSGYPVIYLLDGNAVFGTAVEAMRAQGARPEKTGAEPAVIVGIGYPTDAPFAAERYYDFTLPVSVEELPVRPNGAAWPEHGGAESFLAFLEEELKPQIEAEFRIDSGRRTIVGHSLGGLFVLHALFTTPSSFRTYVAGSPSIHWNKRLLLEEERQFVARLDAQSSVVDIGVLLAVGELEQGHKSGMNDNARQLFERLSALESRGVRAQFKEFEGEGHVSVLPALISRAVRFG